MAILVNGVKVAGVGVPGTNGKDATINGVNALTVEGLDPIVAQMIGSSLQISLSGDIGGAKIETGSYVGTGTYGESTPIEVFVSFSPKAFILMRQQEIEFSAGKGLCWAGQPTNNPVISVAANLVSWYSTTNAGYQYNLSNTSYYWLAIG